MEGIYDGGAVDTCFVCGLLYPERWQDGCPCCGRRMRYVAAAMMDSLALEATLSNLVARYRRAREADRFGYPGRLRPLTDLLETIHRFAPDSLSALARIGAYSLDELRLDYEALSPTLH